MAAAIAIAACDDMDSGGSGASTETLSAAEGGTWGWLACVATIWTNGTIFGILNSFGLIFVELRKHFLEKNPNTKISAFRASWIGSLTIGTTFLCTPIANILALKLGPRSTAFLGGLLSIAGILTSSFIEETVIMYIGYGIILGAGFSLSYAPSLVVLGHYFNRHMFLATVLVTLCSSMFTASLPIAMCYSLEQMGLTKTLNVLSGLVGAMTLFSLLFRSNPDKQDVHVNCSMSGDDMNTKTLCSRMCQVDVWFNKRYLIWTIATMFGLFGYFVPYVHLIQMTRDKYPTNRHPELMITCMNFACGVGRLILGKLSDVEKISGIYLQQMSFLAIGICTIMLSFVREFWESGLLCVVLGLFDGWFIGLIGPLALDMVGIKGNCQALNLMLAFCSIPLTLGPVTAGLLYDILGSYDVAFRLAGAPPVLGCILLFFIPKAAKPPTNGVNGMIQTSEFMHENNLFMGRFQRAFPVSPSSNDSWPAEQVEAPDCRESLLSPATGNNQHQQLNGPVRVVTTVNMMPRDDSHSFETRLQRAKETIL